MFDAINQINKLGYFALKKDIIRDITEKRFQFTKSYTSGPLDSCMSSSNLVV